jgi:hypothetical protein
MTGVIPDRGLSWILRTGVATCFIGHGAYGVMTKAAWLPYFAVAGVGEPAAWQLMPWIGAMDIIMGLLALVWPCRALFLWGVVWCVWTALLRPLAGQGWPEFFERAGNYGVPCAILVVIGLRGSLAAQLPESWTLTVDTSRRLEWTLRLVTFSLLAGHAACALVLKKPALAHHYAIFGPGDPVPVMLAVGWFEAALAVTVLAGRFAALPVFICAWKLASESLMFTSGAPAPFFDFIEHGGSYAAPLALAFLFSQRPVPAPASPVVSRLQTA